MTNFFIPLNAASSGRDVQINNLIGGESICKKLMEMGVNKGAVIKIVKNDSSNLIIKVGESRFILDRGMAQRVLVKEL